MNPGSHGSTYGGNPLVCAASLATLLEIREQKLGENAIRQEARIRAEVSSWNLPVVTQVRGIGLLLGIGLDPSLISISAGETPALHVVKAVMAKGLLIVAAGAETIRLLPPLNVTDSEVDEALAIIKGVLSEFSHLPAR